MTASRRPRFNYGSPLLGVLTLVLGSLGLFGWLFNLPLLTRFDPGWNPMVPSTALCFVLSGLSLLIDPDTSRRSASLTHALLVWLVLLLAGARTLELVSGQTFGIEFLLPSLSAQFAGSGHMSPQTMSGFLAFGIGTLALRRPASPAARMLAGTLTGGLLILGSVVVIGYGLNLQLVFETVYARTGLLWMSFPTAIGTLLLGLGLQCRVLKCGQKTDANPVQQQARQIYRTTLGVLFATALATGLAGVSFLQETVYEQSGTDISHSLAAISSHIETTIEDRAQRAIVVSLAPSLQAAAARLLADSATQPAHVGENLLAHGFSGIGVETDQRRRILAGRLLPDTARFARINGPIDTALTWDHGYVLRIRAPLDSSPGGFLVLEQRLTSIDKVITEANSWGDTGALPMCTRLDAEKLLCFPQREQAAMHVLAATFDGKPIPSTLALAGKRGIAPLTDYRGHRVLAAYGPVADTGLGLVLRKDLAEVYAPIRQELLIALPLILLLVLLGLWLIRLRVKPLTRDMSRAHAAESAARARFDASIQSSPDGFVILESVKNPDGDIVDFRYAYANRHAEDMVGLPPDSLTGQTMLERFPAQKAIFKQYRTVALTREPLFETFSLGSGKDIRWYKRQAVAMPGGVAVTYRDITAEKTLLQQLEYSNRLRSAIVDCAAYSIVSSDVNGTILTFNPAAERMLWYRADELVGKATPEIFHDADEVRHRAEALSHEFGHPVAPGFEVFVAKARMNLQEEREWTYVRKDGSRFPVRLSVTALRDENDDLQGFLGIAYDISEQKRAEEYIRHISLHDVLTGLPNRALLDDRVMVAIEQQHRNGTPFVLAMMDIDRFKHINDSMGHHIGDQLLKAFVERIKSCLRPTDTLARMGGDEFVLLLPESDEAGARIVIERIQQVLTPPIDVGVQEVHITSSIGLSVFPRDGQNLHELLRCADVAMYWVKEHGRNGVRAYSRDIDSGGANRLGLERDLHLALKNGGFSLFYQPKVNLKSDAVFGVEALLRMRGTHGQIISPADFIPLAEDIGLIIPIGKWVLETACRDAVRMQQALGAPLMVAVNISPRQFMSGDLVSTVQEALQQTRLNPGLLELEITESVLMDELSGVATTLSELSALGVKIAIDDFGTGYSSLSYLKRYPIDKLKIDQSFVRDMTNDPGDEALVLAIIAMGHSLSIPVVAEGIETDEQLALLIENDCDMGQGFHIGRPMAFDNLLLWFSDSLRWKPAPTAVPSETKR